MPETKEKVNEDDSSQVTKNLDEKVCRKRKRSSKCSANPQKPIAAPTAELVDTDSDDDDISKEEYETAVDQRARRLTSFEAALDNYINYHIEIEQTEEDRVTILRQTMTRMYEVLRTGAYYTGATLGLDYLYSVS